MHYSNRSRLTRVNMLDTATTLITGTVITGFFSWFMSQRVYQQNPNDIILALVLINTTILWLEIDSFIRSTILDERGKSLWMDMWYYILNFASMTLMFISVQYILNIIKGLFDEVTIPLFEFISISGAGIITLFYFFKLASLRKLRKYNFMLNCLKYSTKNEEFKMLIEGNQDIKKTIKRVKYEFVKDSEQKSD
jgi:hypothetical protein